MSPISPQRRACVCVCMYLKKHNSQCEWEPKKKMTEMYFMVLHPKNASACLWLRPRQQAALSWVIYDDKCWNKAAQFDEGVKNSSSSSFSWSAASGPPVLFLPSTGIYTVYNTLVSWRVMCFYADSICNLLFPRCKALEDTLKVPLLHLFIN